MALGLRLSLLVPQFLHSLTNEENILGGLEALSTVPITKAASSKVLGSRNHHVMGFGGGHLICTRSQVHFPEPTRKKGQHDR